MSTRITVSLHIKLMSATISATLDDRHEQMFEDIVAAHPNHNRSEVIRKLIRQEVTQIDWDEVVEMHAKRVDRLTKEKEALENYKETVVESMRALKDEDLSYE